MHYQPQTEYLILMKLLHERCVGVKNRDSNENISHGKIYLTVYLRRDCKQVECICFHETIFFIKSACYSYQNGI